MKTRKIILFLLSALIIFTVSTSPVLAETSSELPLCNDQASLLTVEQANEIQAKLTDISERYCFDVAIVTVNSFDGKEPMDFADDYFDYNEFGQGEDRDGVVFAIGMSTRKYWISTRGYGKTAINDDAIDYLNEELEPLLKSGDYYEAFIKYADMCDKFNSLANEGTPYKTPANYPIAAVCSLAIGIVLAFIVTAVMKSKLKSVKMNDSASEYVRNGSLKVTASHDQYLCSHVTRTPKPKDNDGGTHVSSSGASHGGGGGSF